MDEKAVQRRRRRDRSVAEAERLAAAYESSGLSRLEFCKRNDLTISTLSRYIRRHELQKAATAGGRQGLVSVELALPAGNRPDRELLVILNTGRRIEVRRGFDADTLEQLIGLLERF